MSKLCLVLLILPCIYGALFAVDLGSEYVKVSLIKPGRVPISVVHNELSKRKTTAVVGFTTTTRIYGDDALGLLTKTPTRVFLRSRDFLGRNAADPFLRRLNGGDTRWEPAYVYAPSNYTIDFQLDNETSITTEEVLASLFGYLKGITKEEAGEPVVDCVIAVPAFFGPVQRRRLMDVAKLAEINVISIVNAHGGAAVQFGIERQFETKPQRVIIYDMGANTIQASLISYSAYESKHLGKTIMAGQFEVLDVTWNENLGGDHLDWALVHYFAKRFNEKFQTDLYTSHRSVWKMKKAVGKAKHVLSANTEAHVYVEELFDGHDYNDKITRTEFENLNAEFFTQAVEPLKRLIERNAVNVSDLLAVELIGGGSRVPKVQSVLSAALDGRSLDRHLDGDEAVVMGAGLVAANLSAIFRLRQFGYMDGAIYPMELHILEPENWKLEPNATSLFKPKPLLPYMKRLPAKRALGLLNLSDVDSFQFEFRFNTSEGRALPPSAENNLYATYNVSGIQKGVEKHGSGGKVVLHFIAKDDGLIDVDRAEYVVEVTEMIQPPKETASTVSANISNNTTTDEEPGTKEAKADNTSEVSKEDDVKPDDSQRSPNETASTNETTVNATESVDDVQNNKTEPAPPPIPKKITKKVTLAVSEAIYAQPSLTPQQMKHSKSVLRKYAKGETLKKKTEKSKNTLESYIVEAQNRLQENLEVRDVTTPKQREAFMTQLTSVEDWLYMDGADATVDVFDQKLKELQFIGEPIFSRAAESINRPLALEKSKKTLDIIEKALNALPEIKPWLMDDLIELANATVDLKDWLKEKEEAQGQLEPHEPPVFTSIEVLQELMKVEKLMTRISNKKPPKPKKTPVNETANITDEATTNFTVNTTETPDGPPVIDESDPANTTESESKEPKIDDAKESHKDESSSQDTVSKESIKTDETDQKDVKETTEEDSEDKHIELR